MSPVKGQARVSVLDLTEAMLVEGRERAAERTWADRLDWIVGDAMALPFGNATFDAYTIAFGIRNVTRPEQALAGDRDSYRYLVESIRRFPDQGTFAGMIRDAGFGRVQYRNLSMGVAALHSGWKI